MAHSMADLRKSIANIEASIEQMLLLHKQTRAEQDHGGPLPPPYGPEPSPSETLLNLEARMEQMLLLQRQFLGAPLQPHAVSDPQFSETLMNIEARIEQMLLLQRQTCGEPHALTEPPGEALLNIEARLQQVLDLQMQTEHDVSELRAEHATAMSTILDVKTSLDQRLDLMPCAREARGIARQLSARPTLSAHSSNLEFGKTGTIYFQEDETGSAPLSSISIGQSVRAMAGEWDSTRASPMHCIPLAPGIAGGSMLDMDETRERLDWLLDPGGQSMKRDSQLGMAENRAAMRMLDPHCIVRVSHDIISIIVLAIDMISAPIVLAWDIELDGVLYTLNIISFSFWCFDIFMSFVTGYYVQGELVYQPNLIAQRYFKTWFAPDVGIILADMVLLAGSSAESMEGSSGVLRMSKGSRWIRLARLFRLVRMMEVFARLTEASVLSEVVIELVKPVMAIILVNHILACIWWSISRYLPSDTGLSWASAQVSSSLDASYIETSVPFQYLTAMHWSLAQQTPGSMEVVPLNSTERAFNCFCLLLGMLLFSSLISSISAKTMQHYIKQKDRLTKLGHLRRFLGNKVPAGVAIAAQMQASKVLSSNTGKPLTMHDIAAIAILPQALQRKVQVELCVKHLRHPLLRSWFILDLHGARAMCHAAIDFIGLAAEDHLFFPRVAATNAYVMTRGAATYIAVCAETHAEVQQGQFFCEAALWCEWKHVGELTATQGCELLSISAEGLAGCLDQDVAVKHVVVQYGRSFHKRLTAPGLHECEPPNDLIVAFTTFDSILPALPAQCRQLIGAAAVSVAKQRRRWRTSTSREVREGRCCLMVNWEGEVERIVSVIVLSLSNPDGRILVQLGEWIADAAQASCKLPGKKQEEGETPSQTIERLFQGALAPLAPYVTYTGAELEVMWKASLRMRVKTKYLRTVNCAELTCQAEALELTRCQAGPRKTRTSVASMSTAPSITSMGTAPSLGLATTDDDIVDQIDIFILVDDEGEISFVSWLSPKEIQYFTTPKGEMRLQRMLDSIVLEPCMVEAAKERLFSCEEPDGLETEGIRATLPVLASRGGRSIHSPLKEVVAE